MNLYLIERDDPPDYDEYDSAVVVANNADEARCIHPDNLTIMDINSKNVGTWIPPNRVLVTVIGVAHMDYQNPTVICASFNAG